MGLELMMSELDEIRRRNVQHQAFVASARARHSHEPWWRDDAHAVIAIQDTAKVLEMLDARWIRVGDRLPEHGASALVFGSFGIGFASCYDGDFYDERGDELLPTITHWMPLPPYPDHDCVTCGKAEETEDTPKER